MIDYKTLFEDYAINGEEDDRMLALKQQFFALSPADRNILLLYAEYGTYTGVAKILHCSSPTCKRKILKIRAQILEKL